jgi:hypothetical protein
VVWRWQERFMQEGADGLLRDKTRKPGKPPLPAETVQRVIDLAGINHRYHVRGKRDASTVVSGIC